MKTKTLMLVDGIIIMNVKFLDCGNVILLILLACTKLKWLTLETEKLIDKVSTNPIFRVYNEKISYPLSMWNTLTILIFSFGRTRRASSCLLGITRGTVAYY